MSSKSQPPDRKAGRWKSSGSRDAVLRRLTTLEAAVLEISRCRTVDSAARAAANLAQHRIGAQAATTYLLNDRGILSRIAIVGKDKDGNPITRKWFRSEAHAPGNSITGRVLPASRRSSNSSTADTPEQLRAKQPNSRPAFGRLTLWTEDEDYAPDPTSASKYRELLGCLKNAAGVPLNGPHRSFGVLEVLNKQAPKSAPSVQTFDEEDLFWLWHVATVLSARISFLRRKEELTLLASIAAELSEPYSTNFDERESFQRIANLLTASSTCFRAAVMRRSTGNGNLQVIAKAGDVNWSAWTDHLDEAAKRVARDAFRSGDIAIISDVDAQIHRFENRGWIQDNDIRAYVCLPLSKPGRPLGTISLFTSFEYIPDEDDQEFLENVQAVASGLANAVQTVKALNRAQDELEDIQLLHLGQTRQVSYIAAIEQELHRYKNDFQQIVSSLQPIVDGRKSGRKAIEGALVPEIANAERRVREIEEQFSETKFQAFNLNFLTQSLFKEFRQRFGRSVGFTLELDHTLPDLEANEAEFREILANLLVNAVSATKETGRKGLVHITTSLRRDPGGEFLELRVEDNGCGIPKEDLPFLFDRNFTTRDTGTGMGLFISYRLIQKYMGEIQVESTVGTGSCFRILIPREPWETDHA